MRPGPRHVRAARPSPSGRSWRRTSLTAVGLVLALIGALTLSAKATSPSAPEPAAAPALLGVGAWADSGPASVQQAATQRLETAIGRPFNIGHSFVPWGAGLGDVPAANLAAGRTPMISFGKGGSWRAVDPLRPGGRGARGPPPPPRLLPGRPGPQRRGPRPAGAAPLRLGYGYHQPADHQHPVPGGCLRGRLAARP
jgi:hypothetical protein